LYDFRPYTRILYPYGYDSDHDRVALSFAVHRGADKARDFAPIPASKISMKDGYDRFLARVAYELGIEVIVFQHERGKHASVTEILDARSRSASYASICHGGPVPSDGKSWFNPETEYPGVWFSNYGFLGLRKEGTRVVTLHHRSEASEEKPMFHNGRFISWEEYLSTRPAEGEAASSSSGSSDRFDDPDDESDSP
jgi:hypothetical protein